MTNIPKNLRIALQLAREVSPSDEIYRRFEQLATELVDQTDDLRVRLFVCAILDGLQYGNWPP